MTEEEALKILGDLITHVSIGRTRDIQSAAQRIFFALTGRRLTEKEYKELDIAE